MNLVANPASATSGKPAKMHHTMTWPDGTQIKFGDPIGDFAAEGGGTLRQIYPVELPNGERIALYQRSGTGDRPGDGGRAAKGNMHQPELSDFSVFKGIQASTGWYIKDGFGADTPEHLRGLGSELQGNIANAFNQLRDEGRLPRKLDMQPHSQLEINDYLGSKEAIKNNAAARSDPGHRWHTIQSRTLAKRLGQLLRHGVQAYLSLGQS